MRFAICDDEIMCCVELENYFNEMNIDSETYQSGEDLVDDYKNNGRRYDAIFIDIEMGGMTGIETANAIRMLDDTVIIIFVTGFTQYAVESFECGVSRYLVKPLKEEKVREALRFIQKKLELERRAFSFYYHKEYKRILCRDIIYCESEHNYVYIRTKKSEYKIKMTLTAVEEKLSPGMFTRLHRGFLVNLRYIKGITSEGVELAYTNQVIPLGRAYRKSFTKARIEFAEKDFY